MLATAESCTGGMVSCAMTDIAGSSAIFERGFVTYSNEAKQAMLGVDAALIAAHGAVSAEVAQAMARGALAHSQADVALAITGVAGPGASERKPAGLVYIAVVAKENNACLVRTHHFSGDRHAVREQAAMAAMGMAVEFL